MAQCPLCILKYPEPHTNEMWDELKDSPEKQDEVIKYWTENPDVKIG